MSIFDRFRTKRDDSLQYTGGKKFGDGNAPKRLGRERNDEKKCAEKET